MLQSNSVTPCVKKPLVQLAIILLASTTLLVGCGESVDSQESAEKAIAASVDKTVKPSYRENQSRANIRLSKTNLSSLLPDLDDYPIRTGQRDSRSIESVEIFTSSEKAGTGRDAFYIELAEAFNRERVELSNGKTAVISIRKIASGLGAQFMLAGRYIPDAFSPSNFLWGEMLNADGITLDTIAEKTAPNTAGIIVKKSKADMITTNGQLDIPKLLNNVSNGSFAMGYTNPYQSSTGLNFLLTVLNAFAEGDESQMLSPDVSSAFEAFQTGVPFVAQTTIQMRDAAQGSGVLDALVMEHQSWVNVTGMKDYTFVPFGVRHDSPLYATPEADDSEREALELFARFIAQQQSVVSRFGFGQNDDYESVYDIEDPSLIAQAQGIWKEKKTGGRPVAAVFVADVSGSMDGPRLRNLKKALVDSSDLISSNNSIGLVTYNESVNVDLYVRKFDVQQKSLFIGAVESLIANGKTATNDAVVVAAKLLIEHRQNNPTDKLIIFVLSDGERNKGMSLDDVNAMLEWSGIPIHSIAYEVQSDELRALAGDVMGSNMRRAR